MMIPQESMIWIGVEASPRNIQAAKKVKIGASESAGVATEASVF